MEALAVFAGAGLGGVLRYGVNLYVAQRWTGVFPLATFLINVSGCFLIGVLATLFARRPAETETWRLLLVVGVLGGYTTFSTFGLEIYRALRDGFTATALGYAAASALAGLAAVAAGVAIGKRMVH